MMIRLWSGLGLACLLAASALATETRVLSLSGAADYVWDNSQVFTYPSVAPLYYRSVMAELGEDGSLVHSRSSVGLLYADEEQSFGVIGLAVNRRSAGYQDLLDYLTPVRNDTFSVDIVTRLQDRNLGRRLMIIREPGASYQGLYARKIGAYTGGILIGRSAWSALNGYGDEERKAGSRALDLTLGLGYEPQDNLRADVALAYSHLSFSSSYVIAGQDSAQNFSSDGAFRLALDGRMFYALNEDMVIVPRLKIARTDMGYSHSQDGDSLPAKGSAKSTGLELGCGWNYQYRSHLKLVAGLDLGYSKTIIEDSLINGFPGDVKHSSTVWAFPGWHLGVEANLREWVTARMGATQRAVSATEVTDYADGTSRRTEDSRQPYDFNTGLTIKMGNLTLDLLLNPEVIFSGGNLASGSKTWPVASAALSYRF